MRQSLCLSQPPSQGHAPATDSVSLRRERPSFDGGASSDGEAENGLPPGFRSRAGCDTVVAGDSPCQSRRVHRNPQSKLFRRKNESGVELTSSTSSEAINPVRIWTTGSKLNGRSFKMKPSTKRPPNCLVSPDLPAWR